MEAIINHDRFLTRIWSIKDEKIIHQGYKIPSLNAIYVGLSNEGIIVKNDVLEIDTTLIPFYSYCKCDFVGMCCIGLNDIKRKLIYELDILKINNETITVYWDYAFKNYVGRGKDNKLIHIKSLVDSNGSSTFCEIVGNAFEVERK